RAARAPASVRRLRRLAAAPDREPRVPAAPRLLGRAPARSPAARAADRPAAADGAQLRAPLRRGRHRAGGAGRPPRPGGARERDPSRNPLYQVALQLLDASTSDAVGPPPLEGLRLEGVDVDVKGHPLDLSLTAITAEHGLVLHVDYATDLYDRERIARLVAHLERVIR